MGKLFLRSVCTSSIVVALALALPFLLPLSEFVPRLEEELSQRLGQPVAIADLRLHLFPSPRLVARDIDIGRSSDLKVGNLEIVPDLASLAGEQRILRVRASRVDVQPEALAMRKAGPKRSSNPKGFHLERVILSEVTVHHPKWRLPVFDADVALTDTLRVKRALFTARDGSVELDLQPNGADSTALSLAARNWTLPAGPLLTFETLTAKGEFKGNALDLVGIEGVLYGGKVSGAAHATWGKQLDINGTAHLAAVDLLPVQQAFRKPAKLSGRLNADAVFSTSAASGEGLRNALAIDGPFEVVGGAYRGMDLAKAGEVGGAGAARGDVTPFEELRGTLELRGKHIKLNDLCVRSPSLVAGGNVEVLPDDRLAGRLEVSVAKTGGMVGVPMSLGGTTSEPSATPTKGYVIGAVIGTVLMPGLGTTIGSSLGGRLEGRISVCK